MSNKKRPLTIPTSIEIDEEGIEWLTFLYTSKGIGTEYRIRIDINNVDPEALTRDFKVDNSVYPKAALVSRQEYKGNRWEYETSVNEIGWRLTYLNSVLLQKRGLLQRAVDSYRNTKSESKSRRVARVEKSMQEKGGDESEDYSSQSLPVPKKQRQIPKKRIVTASNSLEALSDHASATLHDTLHAPIPILRSDSAGPIYPKRGILPTYNRNVPSPVLSGPPGRNPSPMVRSMSRNSATSSPRPQDSRSRLIVETVKNKAPYQFRLRMDIDSIPEGVDRMFVQQNQPFEKPKTHREFLCNSIAWKLAFLNPEILVGKRELLQRSVDVYMEHFEDQVHAPRPGVRLHKLTFSEEAEVAPSATDAPSSSMAAVAATTVDPEDSVNDLSASYSLNLTDYDQSLVDRLEESAASAVDSVN